MSDEPRAPTNKGGNADELDMLHGYMTSEYCDSQVRSIMHGQRAARWGQRAELSAILATVLAFVSALSVLTAYEWVTAGLATLAAIASAYIAKVEPGEKAAASKKVVSDYEQTKLELQSLLTNLATRRRTNYVPVEGRDGDHVYDAGYYDVQYDLSSEERDQIGNEYRALLQKKITIKKDAPDPPLDESDVQVRWNKYVEEWEESYKY